MGQAVSEVIRVILVVAIQHSPVYVVRELTPVQQIQLDFTRHQIQTVISQGGLVVPKSSKASITRVAKYEPEKMPM